MRLLLKLLKVLTLKALSLCRRQLLTNFICFLAVCSSLYRKVPYLSTGIFFFGVDYSQSYQEKFCFILTKMQ